MMKFFTNGAWYPRTCMLEEIPAPVGASCLACGKPIQAGDCGVSMIHMDARGDACRPWHLACFQDVLGVERASA